MVKPFLIKAIFIADLPEWAKSVPYQIKSIAIRDARIAVRLHKAREQKVKVMLVSEAYTSKTINWTGEVLNNLGGKKIIKSPSTNIWMDRDLNGALGIFLKALVDSPTLFADQECIC